MSKHYRNPLMSLSPRTTSNTSYTVPKFEKTHKRSSSFSSPGGGNATSATGSSSSSPPNQNTTNTQPLMRFTMPPSPITPNNRSRSYTAPSVVTPNQSFESSQSFTDDEQSALSVIGMPSEYPVYHRDDSVSSFASSVCSSLLMEELDDFEEFFGRELYAAPPKVYDSHGCSSSDESPLKSERSRTYPPLPLVPRPTHVKTRAVSEPSLQAPQTKRTLQRPNIISARVVSDSSTDSSKSRRRRNFGMDEKDFAQLTNEFSSLIVQ